MWLYLTCTPDIPPPTPLITFTFTFIASCYLWFQLPFHLDKPVHKTVHLVRLHILQHQRTSICNSSGCHNVPTGTESQTFRSSVVFTSSVSRNLWTVTKYFLQTVISMKMEVSTGTSPFRTHRLPTEMYKDSRLAETSVYLHSSTLANQLRQPTQRTALFHTPVLVLLSLALRHILQSGHFPSFVLYSSRNPFSRVSVP
jgi:hypothetical protein